MSTPETVRAILYEISCTEHTTSEIVDAYEARIRAALASSSPALPVSTEDTALLEKLSKAIVRQRRDGYMNLELGVLFDDAERLLALARAGMERKP